MDSICRLYWESFLLHYVLFPVGGPTLGFLVVCLARRLRKETGAFQLLLLLFIVLMSSLFIAFSAAFFCEVQMFGELSDDPGDVGLVLVSLPLWIVSSVLSTAGSVLVIRLQRRRSSRRAA